MAKGGKLMKLKSVLKKLNSFNKKTVTRHQNLSSTTSSFSSSSSSSADLHPVYVGKSRRRYLVTSDVIDHPVFRELADQSSGGDDTPSVACEVVLFDHLLWMLENADAQPENSLDEIVDFYVADRRETQLIN